MKQLNSQKIPYVGDLIAELRRQKGITQEALADCLAIDYSRLGKWERGVHKFPVDQLPLIAQALAEDIIFTKTGEIKIGNEVVSMQTLRTVLQATRRVVERQVLEDGVTLSTVLEGEAVKDTNGTFHAIVEIEGMKKSFENSLYTNPDQSMYLLESRLFDVETDEMHGVYLELLYPDLTLYEEYVDDVWEFDDWELVM